MQMNQASWLLPIKQGQTAYLKNIDAFYKVPLAYKEIYKKYLILSDTIFYDLLKLFFNLSDQISAVAM